MLERIWKNGTLILCWYICKLIQSPGKTIQYFLLKLEMHMSYIQQFSRETLNVCIRIQWKFIWRIVHCLFIIYSWISQGISQISIIIQWINKLWCHNTTKYYPAGKTNEIQVYNIEPKKQVTKDIQYQSNIYSSKEGN